MFVEQCASLETVNGEPLMLSGVSLKGDIRGVMFEAEVEQRFTNPTDGHVEVVYTFPLPWKAVLLGVEVFLGDKHLMGAVVEKHQAEESYENALAEGDAAIMLEMNRDKSFTLNLGNLAVGETCVIRLRYAQLLNFEQGGLRLLLPTVIAPRYADPIADGGLKPHQVSGHSLEVEYPLTLEIAVHGDLARGEVASPSHPISVNFKQGQGEDSLVIALAQQGYLDRDFILSIGGLDQCSVAVQARDFVETDKYTVLASFCPKILSEVPQCVTTKILVDCSGSMSGDSILAARRALQSIVHQVSSGDHFSLSRFGSTVAHRSRGLWCVTEATQTAASRWINSLEADMGGTEMEDALTSTFALSGGKTSDVLLVTDGEISAIDSMIDAARISGHRLFVVGIGSSPAESHLRRLAEETGGACDFVAPGENVEPAILRMFNRLRSPRLTDLSLKWPGRSVIPSWQSEIPLSVFDGDNIHVFGASDQPLDGAVVLKGRRSESGTDEVIATANLQGRPDEQDALSRMAAHASLRTVSRPETVAVPYQLVTEYTNFLLVHIRDSNEKATKMPNLHQVQQMLPAGWGGVGSVRAPRKGAVESNFEYMDIPAMLRRSVAASEEPSFSRSRKSHVSPKHEVSDDVLEVSTFLRQQSWSLDRDDSSYWMNFDGLSGLTPLGLQEWLNHHPDAEWPTNYEELRAIGLGSWVVEWLELTVGQEYYPEGTEKSLVKAFLNVVFRRHFGGRTRQRERKGIVSRVKAYFDDRPEEEIRMPFNGIEKRIFIALIGLEATKWPEQVYMMTRQGNIPEV